MCRRGSLLFKVCVCLFVDVREVYVLWMKDSVCGPKSLRERDHEANERVGTEEESYSTFLQRDLCFKEGA